MADLIIEGSVHQFAKSSANSGSVAALFAALFTELLDFSGESAIVRFISDPETRFLHRGGNFLRFCVRSLDFLFDRKDYFVSNRSIK